MNKATTTHRIAVADASPFSKLFLAPAVLFASLAGCGGGGDGATGEAPGASPRAAPSAAALSYRTAFIGLLAGTFPARCTNSRVAVEDVGFSKPGNFGIDANGLLSSPADTFGLSRNTAAIVDLARQWENTAGADADNRGVSFDATLSGDRIKTSWDATGRLLSALSVAGDGAEVCQQREPGPIGAFTHPEVDIAAEVGRQMAGFATREFHCSGQYPDGSPAAGDAAVAASIDGTRLVIADHAFDLAEGRTQERVTPNDHQFSYRSVLSGERLVNLTYNRSAGLTLFSFASAGTLLSCSSGLPANTR
jgi:hypothetical protein